MAYYEIYGEYHDVHGRFSFGRVSPNYSVGAHWHKAVEIIFIEKGDVLVGVDEGKCVMRDREIVICTSGQIHYFDSLTPDSRMGFVIFDEDVLSGMGMNFAFTETFLSGARIRELGICQDTLDEIDRCFNRMCREKEQNQPYFKDIAKAYLAIMMHIFMRHIPLSRGARKHSANSGTISIMQKALSYIENQYASELSLEKLSWRLSVSPYYLSRLFGQTAGKTFKSYLNYVRISKAKIMICNTTHTILEIALNTGFNNVRTFNRVFKENVGTTPTEYRKRMDAR